MAKKAKTKVEPMDPQMAVFNRHVNNAHERAMAILNEHFPSVHKAIAKLDGQGIMSVFDKKPSVNTMTYVALVTALANGV